MVELNTQGVNTPDDLGGMGSEPVPGFYHVIVQGVDESLQKYNTAVRIDFRVLAGTIPGQEDRIHVEFFSITAKAIDRLKRLAMVLGLIKGNEVRDVSFAEATGRQLIIEVEEQEYQGKKNKRISYMGMWSVGHEKVSQVPLAKEMLSGGQPGSQSATTAPAAGQATAGMSTSDDWSNV